MSMDCAGCDRYACRAGRVDAAPETCPMWGDFPAFETLYDADVVRRLAYHAARVEADGYCRWTRVREVVEVSERMGYRRIGVGSCPDTRHEAELAAARLAEHGLEVVLPEPLEDCDPVGQASLFADRATDFNVIAGMCVGHDSLFMRHSAAPVTSLVVRDVRLRHNPAAALYLHTGYFKSALYGARSKDQVPFRGWDDALLDRLAREVRDAGAARDARPCRLEEVMDFARRAGVRRLGVVYCVGFREEARQLKAVLGTNGFRLSSVCCKTGAVPKERLGITDEEKVHPGRPEMMCNPVAQAELLERDEVELVLLLGQCVGHDSATMARLATPAVCLVAKDRVLGHNTVAALHDMREA
ncbi:MAG TPA: DUF1847 domain-containing protein [Longimicrobiales bacterium]|nr:DUF1847 domain-containing protein [Longimicrobiales bacterium]